MLASLASIPIGMWDVQHTGGDFHPLAAAAFHAIWGALLCLSGAVLSLVGLFRPARTWLSWVSFGLSIGFVAGFSWIVCSLVL